MLNNKDLPRISHYVTTLGPASSHVLFHWHRETSLLACLWTQLLNMLNMIFFFSRINCFIQSLPIERFASGPGMSGRIHSYVCCYLKKSLQRALFLITAHLVVYPPFHVPQYYLRVSCYILCKKRFGRDSPPDDEIVIGPITL